MRIFSIILADDEQQILYGMKKGIEWERSIGTDGRGASGSGDQ